MHKRVLKFDLIDKSGMSLLEILVAMFILSLILVGLANVFVVGRQIVTHSQSRLSASEMGKYALEPLKAAVREDLWSTSSCITQNNCPTLNIQINGVNYVGTYNYFQVKTSNNMLTELPGVKVSLNWIE